VDGTEISTFSVFQTATTDAATTTDATATTDAATTTDATATTDAATTTDATATTDAATTTTTDATAESKKVEVCHGKKTLSIAKNALKAHLAHGDKQGACAGTGATTTDSTTTTPTDTTTDSTTTVDTTMPIEEEVTTPQGVNVAAGDVDGDGKMEIIAAMANTGNTVEIYRDGTLISQFKAFDTSNGVVVATGDADDNGTTDIIVGDASGVEVRVFSLNNGVATQVIAFNAAEQGIITGIAVGKQTASSAPLLPTDSVVVTAAPTEDTTSDSSLGVAAPLCQVTADGINTSCNGNGIVITEDSTVTEDLSVANVSVSSDVINEGLISNSTVQEDATITGGILSGDIINSGILKDITFAGRMLTGGILQGTITITADVSLRLGIVENVTLAAGTHLIGGKLQGTIEGSAAQPALLENTEVASGASLSNVVLGSGVTVSPDASLENVTELTQQ